MLRSLYSGISGLKNHQARMDVIGNNIANVNTTGYKSGRVSFQDSLSQYYSNNPAIGQNQIGTGMKVGSINNNFTQGAMQNTGRTLDLLIQGNGFFGVIPNSSSDTTAMRFTRDGIFFLQEDSTTPGTYNIVNSEGRLLCGTGGEPISISADDAYYTGVASPLATTKVNSAKNDVTSAKAYVTAYTGPRDTAKTALDTAVTALETASNDLTPYISPYVNAQTQLGSYQDALDSAQATLDAMDPSDPGYAAAETARDDAQNDYDTYYTGAYTTAKNDYDTYKAAYDAAQADYDLNKAAYDAAQADLDAAQADLDEATDALNDAQAELLSLSAEKTIGTITIDSQGKISGVDNLGRALKITNGQVALYTFKNTDGLKKEGSNLYSATTASGSAEEGTASAANNNTINSGYLEMSNVDLSQEMVDMISAQRGFQANSRTNTVSDTLLEELINLKR